MKNTLLLAILVVISLRAISKDVEKVDPNHTTNGRYGYLINSDHRCSVWWAEGVYKVIRDAPIPAKTGVDIQISSVKNEYESFILVKNSFHYRERY